MPARADIAWLDVSSDGLYRSGNSGENATKILDFDASFGSSNYFPHSMVAVGNHFYVVDELEKRIYRCGLNGESPVSIVDTTTTSYQTSFPVGIASDGTKLYFALDHRLFSCGLDGSNLTNEFIPQILAGGGSGPYHGVIHDGWYYYTFHDDGVARVKLDGSTGAVIVNMDTSFGETDWVMRGIDTDGTYLYWCAYGDGSGAIYRSNMDGSSPAVHIGTSSRIPLGLAVSASGIYYSEFAQATIKKANLNGTGSTVISNIANSLTWDIAIVPDPPPTHTVTFSEGAHGSRTGGAELVQTITNGGSAIAPLITPDFGWDFTGWDKSLSNITMSQTISAQYAVAVHDVVFNLDGKATRVGGGPLTQSITHGNPAIAPTVSANPGYVFDAWDSDFSSITGDLTVTASFGTTLNNSGPADNAIVTYDRVPNPGETPSTVDVGSLTLNSGIAFELGPNETLQLNTGPLTIESGASFTANGIINGSVINAGLLRIPVLNLPELSNTGVIVVTVETPTTISNPISLDGGYISFTGGTVTIDTPSQTNSGIISTDASLEVTGDYTQTATGALRSFISGPAPGITYSQLQSGGDVSMNGELQIVFRPDDLGYLPEPGDTFDLVVTTGGTITLEPGLEIKALVESTQTGAFDEDSVPYQPFDSGLGPVIDPDDLQLIGPAMFSISLVESNTVLRVTYTGPDLTDFYDNAPSNIFASGSTVSEADGPGTLIATLSATSPVPGGHSFALVPGEGSDDNALFSINGDQLLTAADLDFETSSSRKIRLQATNAENRSYEKKFLIVITNSLADDDDGDDLTEEEELLLGTLALSADSDGDGYDDGDEVNGWGTNPLDPGDRFRFAGETLTINGSMVTLEWQTVVGKAYKVEGNTSLSGPWMEVPGTVNGTGGDVSLQIDVSGTDYRFFRVKTSN